MNSDPVQQLDLAFQMAVGRKPGAHEITLLGDYARKYGLANACRVLFNSTEFMFVD